MKPTNIAKFTQFFSCPGVLLGQWVSWLTLAMLIILSINVLASWLFNKSSILLSESITWMHSANFLLAMAYTLNRNNHVRVDIFYAKMSIKAKAWVDLLGTLILLIPVSLFILWSSWSYVLLSWRIGETSAEAGGIPATYILKGFLMVMPVLLLLEAIHQVTLQLSTITRKTAEPSLQNKGAN
jgi:TRAP-type mannitol/chloroaromatic compound transport system permease small subunit